MTVTDADAATNDSSPNAINTFLHEPNIATAPDAANTTAENKTSVRKLIGGQEYPVANGDISKKGFDRKAAVEKFRAYLHDLFQLPGYPRYTGDRIILCTWLQLLPIDNNAMLGAAQFMIHFPGIHFNTTNALYIKFQKHASIFVRQC